MTSDSKSRLQQLKEQFAIQRKPFPLWALLALQHKSRSADTYVEHMAGFKELAAWLAPIEIPPHKPFSIPKLHVNYELNQIAVILNVHPSVVYQEYNKWLTSDLNNYPIPPA
jgi:hypothetical protein